MKTSGSRTASRRPGSSPWPGSRPPRRSMSGRQGTWARGRPRSSRSARRRRPGSRAPGSPARAASRRAAGRSRTPSRSKACRVARRSRGSASSITRSPPVTAARPMKLPISMWSARTRCRRATELAAPVDVQEVRADPLDVRAHRLQELAQLLHVRLARGVHDRRSPLGERRGHERVLGTGHRGLVEEELGAREARRAPRTCRRRSISTIAPSPASANRCVSTRRRPITSPPGGGTSARPKRPSSGPASRIDARIRSASRSSSAVVETSAAHTRTSFGPDPRDLGAEIVEQLEHRLDVADARHVRELDRLGGQQRRGEQRQRCVLVPLGANTPGDRPATLDDEVVLGSGAGHEHAGQHLGVGGDCGHESGWRPPSRTAARLPEPSGRALARVVRRSVADPFTKRCRRATSRAPAPGRDRCSRARSPAGRRSR